MFPGVIGFFLLQFSPSRMEEQRGRFFYDEASERIAVKDEIIEGLNTTNYWEIFDHKSVI